MDEFVQVIPEDTNEDEGFHDDLEPMLEEYRKSKQDKQVRLERRAAEDGRPFSAPVESPGCDSIRRRTEGDKALKEHPPGDSRVVYRPSSGSGQLWSSNSSGGVAPETVGDLDAGLLPHQIEAALPAVPEEQIAQGQAEEISMLSDVQEEGLPDDTDLLHASGDSLDIGAQLDLTQLCLEDGDGVDEDLSSLPGSDDPLPQKASMADSFECSDLTVGSPSQEGAGSLRYDVMPHIPDQPEQMPIASAQAAELFRDTPAVISPRPSESQAAAVASIEASTQDVDMESARSSSYDYAAGDLENEVSNDVVFVAEAHLATQVTHSGASAGVEDTMSDAVGDVVQAAKVEAQPPEGECAPDVHGVEASMAHLEGLHEDQALDLSGLKKTAGPNRTWQQASSMVEDAPKQMPAGVARQMEVVSRRSHVPDALHDDATLASGSAADILEQIAYEKARSAPDMATDGLRLLALDDDSDCEAVDGKQVTAQSSGIETASFASEAMGRPSAEVMAPVAEHGQYEHPEQAQEAQEASVQAQKVQEASVKVAGVSSVPQAHSIVGTHSLLATGIDSSRSAATEADHALEQHSVGVRQSSTQRATSEVDITPTQPTSDAQHYTDWNLEAAAGAHTQHPPLGHHHWTTQQEVAELDCDLTTQLPEPLSQPQTRAPGVSGHMSVRSYAITGLEAAELRHQEASVSEESTPRPTAASIGPTSPLAHRASERNIDLRQAEEPLEDHLQAGVVRTIEAAGAQPPGRKPADPPASPVLQIHASDDLTNSKVVDRLVAFSVGQMGVEALLQGNVIGAIKFLLEAQQRGVTVVADTLRRAVTLAVGSASPSSSTATAAAVQKVLSDLIGLVGAAAQQGDLTQLMLEAHMDRTLTEVPKSLGDLYQQSRAALQRILHTEARLLHGTDPAGGTEDRSMEIGRNSAASGTQGAQLHMDDSCGRCGGTGGTQGGHDAEAGARAESPPGEAEVSGPEAALMAVQEVAGGGAGVAACACGRPLLVGTSDGWLRVPTARHSRARRTVSGKNRVHKGRDLPAGVQQHLEEAMQPDGADLEYIYLPGSSRPPSATQRLAPVLVPSEPLTQEHHHGSRREGSLQRPRFLHPEADVLGDLRESAALPVRRGGSCGPRPATAQPQRREWDDSLAGAPPRTKKTSYAGLRSGRQQRPQSAGPTQRAGPPSWSGGGGSGRFRERQTPWDEGVQDHPAALLTGMQQVPYTQEFLNRQAMAEGMGNYFQSPTGSWYPAQARAPVVGCGGAWKGGDDAAAYHAPGVGGHVQQMQQVYADQIHEMLRYANQCAAALGLRYRYKAAQRRPSSALASRSRMPVLEGYVERHLVSADGAGVMHDPAHVSMLTYAKFASVVEGLSIRVNSSRLFAPVVKQKRKKGTRRQKDNADGGSKIAAYGRR